MITYSTSSRSIKEAVDLLKRRGRVPAEVRISFPLTWFIDVIRTRKAAARRSGKNTAAALYGLNVVEDKHIPFGVAEIRDEKGEFMDKVKLM